MADYNIRSYHQMDSREDTGEWDINQTDAFATDQSVEEQIWDGWNRQNIRPRGDIGTANLIDGRLQIILRDTDQNLWETQEASDGHLRDWKLLKEKNCPRTAGGNGIILALHRRDGRMVAFQIGSDCGVWNDWMKPDTDCGEIFWEKTGGITGNPITVCERCSGGLEVFLVDPMNRLWHRWSNPQAEWSRWVLLGGPVTGKVAVANNREGFPQVFARGTDNSLWTRRHHEDGMWGVWTALDGCSTMDPVAVQETDGRIRLITVGRKGEVRTCLQEPEPDKWGNWVEFSSLYAAGCTAAVNRNGKTELRLLDYRGGIYRLTLGTDGFRKIDSLHGKARELCLARYSDGRLWTAAVGMDGYLYTCDEPMEKKEVVVG